MVDINLGISLFEENKFDQAAEFFHAILNQKSGQKETLTSYEYLIKIYELLHMQIELVNVENEYIEFLHDNRLDIKRINALKKYLGREYAKDRSKYLRELWGLLSNTGKVGEAKHVLTELIEYLVKKKMTYLLTAVLEDYKNSCGEDEFYIHNYLTSLILEGKIEQVDKYLEKSILKNLDINKLFPCFVKSIDMSLEDNLLNIGKYKFLSLYYMFVLASNKKMDARTESNLLNTIYDLISMHGIFKQVLCCLLDYIYTQESYRLYISDEYYAKLINNYELDDNEKEQLTNKLDRIRKELAQIEEDISEEVTINLDHMGEIFKPREDENKLTEIRRLERDIIFLKKIGKNEQAQEKIQQLKRQDGNNTILERNEEQTSSITKQEAINDIENVLFEINQIIGKEEVNAAHDQCADMSERAIIKSIDLLEYKVIKKSYRDIIASLVQQGMYKAALFIIEKIKEDKSINYDNKTLIELEYYKCSALFEKGDYSNLVICIDELLDEVPLLDHEMVNFLYMKAEAFRIKGLNEEAFRIYKKIEKIDKNYRLVELRIKELE